MTRANVRLRPRRRNSGPDCSGRSPRHSWSAGSPPSERLPASFISAPNNRTSVGIRSSPPATPKQGGDDTDGEAGYNAGDELTVSAVNSGSGLRLRVSQNSSDGGNYHQQHGNDLVERSRACRIAQPAPSQAPSELPARKLTDRGNCEATASRGTVVRKRSEVATTIRLMALLRNDRLKGSRNRKARSAMAGETPRRPVR